MSGSRVPAEFEDDPPHSGVSDLAHSLLEVDLKRKKRAIIVAARRIPLEPDVSRFLTRLASVGESVDTPTLLSFRKELSAQAAAPSQSERDSDEIARRRSELVSLQMEVAAYLGYLATLLEFSHKVEHSEALQLAKATEIVENLTRARQYFAINPSVPKRSRGQITG